MAFFILYSLCCVSFSQDKGF